MIELDPERIKIKRVYRRPRRSDGVRVLVDRLWPRGLKRDQGYVDHWMKDIAPSTELRKWFGHQAGRWREFRTAYRRELAGHSNDLHELQSLCANGTVTLLYAAKDETHNNAVVLKDWLQDHAAPEEDASTPRAPLHENQTV